MAKVLSNESIVHHEFLDNRNDVEETFIYMDEVLKTLENDSVSLEKKKELIEEFNSFASKWEVVTVTPNDKILWVQTPTVFSEIHFQLSWKERLKTLLKSKILLKPALKQSNLEFVSNIALPLNLIVKEEDFNITESKEINLFYCKLTFIIFRLSDIIESSQSADIGIFDKPNGIIASNKLKGWISEIENKKSIPLNEVKETIKITTIKELIEETNVNFEGDEENNET